jgi:pyruvate/2-oxoacid:ferredoxin oxidoreductase beta subunit/Pyruvate/2-oxoacid:ferredoxin oxidoreductase gamma subunit
MSGHATVVTPLATYRNDSPYPFCPGCGHGPILDRLNEALVALQLDPRRVVLVTDIGCSGLSDQYFVTSGFHGLHGRSVTYASGIKLARPELTVVVIMGDGGTGIGGTHLVNAARRNIDITVLVFNNFNYGMTGGQHSATTPAGGITATTPAGNLEQPLDVCATVAVNGAGYVYRGTSFDADLTERIAEGIRHRGFSLLDIWEPCTAYYAPKNRLNRKALKELLERLRFATGVIQRTHRPDFGTAYRNAYAGASPPPDAGPRVLSPRHRSVLEERFSLVVAGSAGERVGTAVRLVARAAVLSGLWSAVRSDYPVTVKTGHSVSELVLSPEPIDYAGIARPDALLILSADGRRVAGRYLQAMTERDRVFALPPFADVETAAPVTVIDPAQAGARLTKGTRALASVVAVVRMMSLVPQEALDEAAPQGDGEDGELGAAVAAGAALAARAEPSRS